MVTRADLVIASAASTAAVNPCVSTSPSERPDGRGSMRLQSHPAPDARERRVRLAEATPGRGLRSTPARVSARSGAPAEHRLRARAAKAVRVLPRHGPRCAYARVERGGYGAAGSRALQNAPRTNRVHVRKTPSLAIGGSARRPPS